MIVQAYSRRSHVFRMCSPLLGVQPTLTDVTLVTSEADLPEDLRAPGLKLFVCSVDAALQRKVVDACDTLTTSLGPVSRLEALRLPAQLTPATLV